MVFLGLFLFLFYYFIYFIYFFSLIVFLCLKKSFEVLYVVEYLRRKMSSFSFFKFCFKIIIWVISMDFSLPYVNFHRGSIFDLVQLSNWTKWIINIFFQIFFPRFLLLIPPPLFYWGKKKTTILQHLPHLHTIWTGASDFIFSYFEYCQIWAEYT
jgi:hypothetical protein